MSHKKILPSSLRQKIGTRVGATNHVKIEKPRADAVKRGAAPQHLMLVPRISAAMTLHRIKSLWLMCWMPRLVCRAVQELFTSSPSRPTKHHSNQVLLNIQVHISVVDPDPYWIRIQELCGSGPGQIKIQDKIEEKGVRFETEIHNSETQLTK